MGDISSNAVVTVGVDGSEGSRLAVTWADDYAIATGASLRLVTSWAWSLVYGVPLSGGAADPNADAHDLLEKARTEIQLPASRVSGEVVEGLPGPVLVARCDGASLLVVGVRGRNPLHTLLLGSVSSYCAHHASVPVTIVR